jgi:uncharacterized protein YggT (Ycf19 family)
MLILHRILGIYRWIIIIWAVMTWIPFQSGSIGQQIHQIVGLPVVPVLNLFSFASFNNIGFSAIILLGIIWFIEEQIERRLKQQGVDVWSGPREEPQHPQDEDSR